MKKALLSLFAMTLASAAFAQPPGGGAGGGMPDNATIMSNNDGNGDGEITKAEAEEAGLPLGQNWDMFDLDSDGKVTDEELTQARGQLGAPGGGFGGAGGPGAAGAGATAPAAAEDMEEEEGEDEE